MYKLRMQAEEEEKIIINKLNNYFWFFRVFRVIDFAWFTLLPNLESWYLTNLKFKAVFFLRMWTLPNYEGKNGGRRNTIALVIYESQPYNCLSIHPHLKWRSNLNSSIHESNFQMILLTYSSKAILMLYNKGTSSCRKTRQF